MANILPTPHIERPTLEVVHTSGFDGDISSTLTPKDAKFLWTLKEYPAVGHAILGIPPDSWIVVDLSHPNVNEQTS